MKSSISKFFAIPDFFSLRLKINLSYALLILLMVLGTALSYLFLSKIGEKGIETMQYRQPTVLLALEFEAELHLSNSILTHYLLTGEKKIRDEYQVVNERLNRYLAELKQMAKDPRALIDKEELLAVEKGLATCQLFAKTLIALRQDRSRNYPGIKMATDNLNPISLEYLGLVNAMLSQVDELETEKRKRVHWILHEIRYSWVQMTNSLRIFMSTRVAADLANLDIYKEQNKQLHQQLLALGVEFDFGEVARLDQLRKDYMEKLPTVVEVFMGNHWRADVDLIRTQVSPAVLQLRQLFQRLAEKQLIATQRESEALSLDLREMGIISFVLLICFLMLASLLAVFLSSRILPPLHRLVAAARTVAKGERDVVVVPAGRDELGQLAQAFNTMVERVRMADEQNQQAREQAEKAHKEMEYARDEALVATQAKSSFLSNMSHEIRTPLNAILGFSQILKQSNLGSCERKAANTIERSGNHLLNLINNILDLSKIEAGKIALHNEIFDLADMLADIEDLFSLRCAEKGLALRFELPDKISHYVLGDQARLRQILINLLGNAIKFTEQGAVSLTTYWSKNSYSFAVQDSGNGIPLALQEAIFQPFHQEKEGLEKGGTGLGLNIAKRQVDLLGGHLEVDSELGQGARFYFSIPMKWEKEAYISVAQETAGEMQLKPGFSAQILVVDDMEESRRLLRNILQKAGIQVREAGNGKEAFGRVEEASPDLVYLDIRMPIMDGHECLALIREKLDPEKKIKFVAVSATGFEKDVAYCLRTGFDDFIRKPFLISEILSCTAKLLQIEFESTLSNKIVAVEKEKEENIGMPLPIKLLDSLKKSAELGELTQFESHLCELRLWKEEAAPLAQQLSDQMRKMDADGVMALLEQCGVEA